MKKLFALLIAAGCLTSYNAMAQEKNNMTEFKSSPQEAIIEKYSYYKAEVPAEEELPMTEDISEGDTEVEETISEGEEVISEAEEGVAEAQEVVAEIVNETEEKVTLPTEVTE